MTHQIQITQEFHVTRKVVLEVDAPNVESALELVESGAIDTPQFDDPRWVSGWDLEIEKSAIAPQPLTAETADWEGFARYCERA
jgi:hypothetical protein